jgi:hypothetical protein
MKPIRQYKEKENASFEDNLITYLTRRNEQYY